MNRPPTPRSEPGRVSLGALGVLVMALLGAGAAAFGGDAGPRKESAPVPTMDVMEAAARPAPPPDAGTAAPAPVDTGRPACVRVGTRSEGWAWPSGRFIHWAKCKGVVPVCEAAGKEGQGWYARGTLIARDQCPRSGSRRK